MIASTSGAEPNRTGSVAGSPVSSTARATASCARASFRSYVFRQMPITFVGRTGGALVDLHELGEWRDLHPRLAAVVVADVVAGRLMAQDQRVGAAPVQQPECDAGVARVNQAPLPFNENDVGVLGRLEH